MQIPRINRLGRNLVCIRGTHCRDCGEVLVGHRTNCAQCGGANVDSREFKNVGALLSFTQVFNPAAGYESVSPYFIGLIQIDDGPRLLAQLTDVRSDVVVTGMRMEAVVRRLKVDGDNGPILYGSKFRPLFMSQESKPEPQ